MRCLSALVVLALPLAITACFGSVGMMVALPIAQRLLMLPAIALSYEVNTAVASPSNSTEAREGPRALRRDELWALAREGDAESQYKLATALYRGIDGPSNATTASEWYLKAAEQNHGRSQSKLGLLHQHGHGVAQDPIRAYMWYTLALDNGLRWVEPGFREKLAATMTEQQITQAEQLAWQWMDAHPS